MDLLKIGSFLKELRKEKGISQEHLGEALGVSNKTISRWETGTYLPPVEMLQLLGEYYQVSINEILAGRRLPEEEYKAAAEENLKTAIRDGCFSVQDRVAFYKRKWLKEHVVFMVVLGIAFLSVAACALLTKNALLLSCCPMLFLVIHCVRNNAMMSYVEQKAYCEGREVKD